MRHAIIRVTQLGDDEVSYSSVLSIIPNACCLMEGYSVTSPTACFLRICEAGAKKSNILQKMASGLP